MHGTGLSIIPFTAWPSTEITISFWLKSPQACGRSFPITAVTEDTGAIVFRIGTRHYRQIGGSTYQSSISVYTTEDSYGYYKDDFQTGENHDETWKRHTISWKSTYTPRWILYRGYSADSYNIWSGDSYWNAEIEMPTRVELRFGEDLACGSSPGTSTCYDDNWVCFEGYIGEIFIWSTELTEGELIALDEMGNYRNGYLGGISCFGIWEMHMDVCSGHGTCVEQDKCECREHYEGQECENWRCYGLLNNDTKVCSHPNGTCNDPEFSGVDFCQCKNVPSPGYYGDVCESWECSGIDHRSTDVCSGKGKCVAPNLCVCEENVSGDDCDLWFCFGVDWRDGNECTGHGDCVGPDYCTCTDVRYEGEKCDLWRCNGVLSNDPNVCSNHGWCDDYDLECNCDEFYIGTNCEEWKCGEFNSTDPLTCSNRGSCISPNNCSCSNGYEGVTCDKWRCNGTLFDDVNLICSVHGECVLPETCICNDGYTGDTCSVPICNGITDPNLICSGNGVCVDGVCNCNSGYTALNCDELNDNYECFGVFHYYSNVCTGNGACTHPNNCKCNHGFKGEKCDVVWLFCDEIPFYYENVCSGNGICSETNKCSCYEKYFGPNCELEMSEEKCFQSTISVFGGEYVVDQEEGKMKIEFKGKTRRELVTKKLQKGKRVFKTKFEYAPINIRSQYVDSNAKIYLMEFIPINSRRLLLSKSEESFRTNFVLLKECKTDGVLSLKYSTNYEHQINITQEIFVNATFDTIPFTVSDISCDPGSGSGGGGEIPILLILVVVGSICVCFLLFVWVLVCGCMVSMYICCNYNNFTSFSGEKRLIAIQQQPPFNPKTNMKSFRILINV